MYKSTINELDKQCSKQVLAAGVNFSFRETGEEIMYMSDKNSFKRK